MMVGVGLADVSNTRYLLCHTGRSLSNLSSGLPLNGLRCVTLLDRCLRLLLHRRCKDAVVEHQLGLRRDLLGVDHDGEYEVLRAGTMGLSSQALQLPHP